ncbi:winged helix-turn-helix domain-containing protein [Nocardiopsis akebiae]|uniref:Winged helix-turn-helix domain-containing protein n=1 Tax=Nocardiopsis akebiae TaxID=2831968 RepID=A0ABX8BZ91_9ACTN|nr:BTAD domain-containing putative transcriptional regulator [Nocardiopsis akebiae]QUX27393.1 winged helix-turn-helix domain-containing protein [Nocardiopsis akebiae]
MRFGVLGPVRAFTDGGRAVPIPERKARVLLAALLAHRGWPVSADRLVEWLWADGPRPGSPGRALQRKVWALRRALEEAEPGARELVRHRPPGYLLDVPPASVDAERFQLLADAARDAAAPRERVRLLTEALELWRGPAYADVADEEFARPAAARLEERRLGALEEHALVRLDLGEHRGVTGPLGALVAEHPLRERLVAAYMRALYEGGRQAEALAAHTALAGRLREELGVDPGPEVAELHGRILRHQPTPPVPGGASGPGTPVEPVPATARASGFPTEPAPRAGAVRATPGAPVPGAGGAAAIPGEPFPQAGSSHGTPEEPVSAPGNASGSPGEPLPQVEGGHGTPEAPASGTGNTPGTVSTVPPRAGNARGTPETPTPVPGTATRTRVAPPAGAAPAHTPTGRVFPPLPLTALVGREEEQRRVARLLAGVRLVTLTGIGGVGKTRLALALAHELAPGFGGGAHVVEFAAQRTVPGSSASEPDPVTTLARALGVRDGGGADPLRHVLGALEGRHALLVLDNCEHIADEVAELVGALLGRLPDLRVLATSREPLGVPGEVLFGVEPLPVPSADTPADRVGDSGAVRLFAERAAASAPGFALTPDNAADVALLCRRLDGIPLALELAATRVRALGVTGVLSRLDDRFRLLATARRHLPPRQRTLRAMVDWSWELLDERERVLLRRLAVFTGGCAPEDAEAVCSGGGIDAADVVDLLTSLVDRSLVVAVDDPLTGRRHRLLESIADYACQRLSEAGEAHVLRGRHLDHYTALAHRYAGRILGSSQGEALRRLDAEASNLRAALDEAVGRGAAGHAARLVNSLGWYWYMCGRYREGRRLTRRVRDAVRGSASAEAAMAGATAAVFEILAGDGDDHTALARTALRAFDDLPGASGDAVLERARAAWMIGFVLYSRGDRAVSEDLVAQALAVFRERDDRWGLAAALTARASHALGRGDLDAAGVRAREALELFRGLGDRWGQLNALSVLAMPAEATGRLADAARFRGEALGMAEELELWSEAAGAMAGLGRIALLEGDLDRADELHRRALELVRGQGDVPGEQYAQLGLGLSARRRGRLAEAERYVRPIAEWSARVGWLPGAALALAELGFSAELRGDAAEALRLHREGLAAARLSGDPRALALALEGVAAAHTLTGRHGEAAGLLGAAGALREGAGAPVPAGERGDVDRAAARARAALGEAEFARAFARGRTRPLADLLDGGEPHPDPA